MKKRDSKNVNFVFVVGAVLLLSVLVFFSFGFKTISGNVVEESPEEEFTNFIESLSQDLAEFSEEEFSEQEFLISTEVNENGEIIEIYQVRLFNGEIVSLEEYQEILNDELKEVTEKEVAEKEVAEKEVAEKEVAEKEVAEKDEKEKSGNWFSNFLKRLFKWN
jgi:hypothetical protein